MASWSSPLPSPDLAVRPVAGPVLRDPASSLTSNPDSDAHNLRHLRHHAYSRKQKSLGLLCSNFVALYDRDGVESIGLDDASRRLGVERRRIYDIVNVSVPGRSRAAHLRCFLCSWLALTARRPGLDDSGEISDTLQWSGFDPLLPAFPSCKSRDLIGFMCPTM